VFFLLGRYSLSKYAILWLVVSSLFFYGWWNPAYLGLILLSVVVNYFTGISISKFNASRDSVNSYRCLVLGVLFNLSLLGFFKYNVFFINTVNDVFSVEWHFYYVILPIGISFFTLQQIAYLIDTRRNETSEHNFLQYTLFVVFFPQLIAGPIVHHKQMLPQFLNAETYHPAFKNIAIGLSIFTIGLFKKVVLADNLADYVSPVFSMAEAGQAISFFQAWTATLAYSLQLYFDFSGYSDMAIGLARIFGIILPLNFYSPYKATSVIDFWRRWHITLSQFLRDYVYIYLGGNKRGNARRLINIMLTMLVGGLWHGAAWTFVAWGALHGFYIIINHLWRMLRGPTKSSWWRVWLSRGFTFLLISLAWVLFRAESFEAAIEMYKGLINIQAILFDESVEKSHLMYFVYGYYVDIENIKLLFYLVCIVVLLWVLPSTHDVFSKQHKININKHPQPYVYKYFDGIVIWSPSFLWAIFIASLFIISFINLTEVSEFLYFQF